MSMSSIMGWDGVLLTTVLGGDEKPYLLDYEVVSCRDLLGR